MCGENGTNTERRQAIISAQIATPYKNFREILFHFLGRENYCLYRAVLETWLDHKEPISSTQFSARTEAVVNKEAISKRNRYIQK